MPVRALRGATTVDRDEPDHITERVVTLLRELWARNDVHHDDLISIIFATTCGIGKLKVCSPERRRRSTTAARWSERAAHLKSPLTDGQPT